MWSRPITDVDVDTAATAAATGDTAAATALLAYLQPILLRRCRHQLPRCRPVTAAEDVAQDVCLAVLSALPRWRRDGAPFLALVHAITAHKIADAHRAAARDRTLTADQQLDDEAADGGLRGLRHEGPEQALLARELALYVRALMRTLLPRQRAILVMRVALGMTADETADVVGTTPGAVRVAQHNAIARLRRTIGAAA